MTKATDRASTSLCAGEECDSEGRKDPAAGAQVDGKEQAKGGRRVPWFDLQVDVNMDQLRIRFSLVDIRSGEVLDCDCEDYEKFRDFDAMASRAREFKKSLISNGVL